ncbi:MAG: acetylxylan esterase [Kiritimatiellae bacterium]|nr:acetylxylan esterase [Kiritimatiellia bacterium]
MDLGREPRNLYGSLQPLIERMRAHRPLDLNAERWRAAHPDGTFEEWAEQARACLLDGLHYEPGPLDLQAETLERRERDAFIVERIMFNTTPWFRVPGYFFTPKHVPLPAPALVVFHEWGGPMLFGADRVVGEPCHPAIVEHRAGYTSGRPLADWYASHGYAVIVIDAYHFGNRTPRGVGGLPTDYEPNAMSTQQIWATQDRLRDLLYLGVRQLNWAGTTWMGVNYWDDSRCMDYLLSRPEVDGARIGCTGLSGGGWRTNIMAALEPRIKAAVSVGWMTTGDAQQAYNIAGAIGTFCLLPGVWNRMDVPDLIAMAAPKACMVVLGQNDVLVPPLGYREAARQIRAAFDWAGCPAQFKFHNPPKPHCYDADVQREALAWFDAHLARTPAPAALTVSAAP